jgi:4'-phosphopantetheinyl transferase EntD
MMRGLAINFQSSNAKFFSLRLPLEESELKMMQSWLPQSLKKAHKKRQNEFLAGRFCAFHASKQLNVDLLSLPINANDRSPQWPEHLIGSISHSKKMAIAAVAIRTKGLMIGVDLENIISFERIEIIEGIVASKNELKIIHSCSNEDKLSLYTLLFSAKEALYKALYPFCQTFINFEEVEMIRLDLTRANCILKLSSPKKELHSFQGEYHIQFNFYENSVITFTESIFDNFRGSHD